LARPAPIPVVRAEAVTAKDHIADPSNRSDSEGAELLYEDSARDGPNDTGLSDEKREEIRAMEWGARPDPSEHLSSEYIQQHLEKFEDGASRFMPQENLDKYGLYQRDGTSFVTPTGEVDKLLAATQGDPRA
jgi:hypothetical protein